MSLSPWDEGSDSDHATGLTWDLWLAGHHKIPAWQRAKLPRYRREWAVEVRPFTAEKRLLVSEAQGLSGEAVKGNPTPTVIPGVDESKPSLRAIEDLTEPSALVRSLIREYPRSNILTEDSTFYHLGADYCLHRFSTAERIW